MAAGKGSGCVRASQGPARGVRTARALARPRCPPGGEARSRRRRRGAAATRSRRRCAPGTSTRRSSSPSRRNPGDRPRRDGRRASGGPCEDVLVLAGDEPLVTGVAAAVGPPAKRRTPPSWSRRRCPPTRRGSPAWSGRTTGSSGWRTVRRPADPSRWPLQPTSSGERTGPGPASTQPGEPPGRVLPVRGPEHPPGQGGAGRGPGGRQRRIGRGKLGPRWPRPRR